MQLRAKLSKWGGFLCFLVVNVTLWPGIGHIQRVANVQKVTLVLFCVSCRSNIRFRLCHPERFSIRRMIHKALVTHTTALDSLLVPEPHGLSLQHIDKWLQTLLRLLDEVLLEGYCRDHESLDLINRPSNELVCHFCGSCLFLSCFRCVGDCSNTGRDSVPEGSPIFICPTCYVEGRTCGCGNMDPERLSSISHMLQDRNRAAEVLSKFHFDQGVQTQEFAELSEGYASHSFLPPTIA